MQTARTTPSKRWLLSFLNKHGVVNLEPLENPKVSERNFILALHRSKYAVGDEFFTGLANELGLPFIEPGRLGKKSEIALALPYKALHENLILPFELSDQKLKVATANPLNTKLFKLLEHMFGARVELYVASINAIEDAIDSLYRERHRYQALHDLRDRNPEKSAYQVLHPWQKHFIIGLLLAISALLILDFSLSFILIFATVNAIYFCCNPVKFYVAFRGFKGSQRSVRVSDRDLSRLDERALPVYTILIPIYREAHILSHIVENIMRMDYPREKLDIKILLEENDEETIREAQRLGLLGNAEVELTSIMKLTIESIYGKSSREHETFKLDPGTRVVDSEAITIGTLENAVPYDDSESILRVRCENGQIVEIPQAFVDFAGDVVLLKGTVKEMKAHYMNSLKMFDAVIVPDDEIKTKPRACNYGLLRARGEYCVIYDAEDDPEPDQLKKAVVAFSRAGGENVCLQSRLNFYNTRDNLLTRWFSLEFSFWYDYYLEGLDHVSAPIPLGGTSNHFRTKALLELGGWDPYNVTEDADLGVRISRTKMMTAMLNTCTYEEANKKVPNWIRQRSRWSKGHVQTYLVHMRHPRKLLREMGWKQFLYFQLTFGGNVFIPLVNPMLWAVTLLALVAPAMFQFLFFYPVLYFCEFNLIVGNAVFILLHTGPYLLTKRYKSIPLALTIPLYWILMSVGEWRGMIQLITKPFYWEKTPHGLTNVHGKTEEAATSP